MVGQLESGIVEYKKLEKFEAYPADIAAKDQIALMSRCWFSLTPNRTEPIEHEFTDSRTGRVEKIRITGSPEHGIATIYDQDLLIFAISQWIEAKQKGVEPSRRISFTPYQFFNWMGKSAQGTAYARLKEALQRLKTTDIYTTILSENGSDAPQRKRIKSFSWISEWEVKEENGKIRGVEIVLAEWLLRSIKDFQVLTLDKRYFDISGTVERWLYLYARKATGGKEGAWKESFKSLYGKSASEQEFKHYASRLRKIARKNGLPGLSLESKKSDGKDVLHMARTEKRISVEPKPAESQLRLIELSPLEEAWANVYDVLSKQLGDDIAKSWFKPLIPLSFESGILTYKAPTKFFAERIESLYRARIIAAWESTDYEIEDIKMIIAKPKSDADSNEKR
jgi:plasmid replication initiation protein